MKRFSVPAFWQAVLVVVVAYLIYEFAFPPLMPRSVMVMYLSITVVGVLLYFSFDDERWAEFKAPILSVLRDERKSAIRWGILILVPSLMAYVVYGAVRPSMEPPVELRQVHPAPPSSIRAYNKEYDLTTLKNPIRMDVLKLLKTDPVKAKETYSAAVRAGSVVYYQNCVYCHGDLLDGRGMFADGLIPRPANFRDVGTIAQLQEAFLFWRITTGGPGLPKEGAPWNSAMPVWHEMLREDEVWDVITFLYDHVGQVPRMWDEQVSKAVTHMRDEVQAQRAHLSGKALYEFHCAVCHGKDGAGDGPAAAFLYPKPRNFTTGLFKYKRSPVKTIPPTDEDLYQTIREGLPGTAMPAWKLLLSKDQIRSLLPVIKGFDTTGTWAPETAPDSDFDKEGRYKGQPLTIAERVKIENQIPFTEDSVAKSKRAFEKTCAQCHGKDGRGNPAVDKRLRDDWGQRIWPRDLTKPWTWRFTNVANNVDETIRNIYTRLSVGIPGTPMPAHAGKVSEEDRWHIANYVYTLRNYHPSISKSPVIRALKLEGPLPSSVNDPAWAASPSTTLLMLSNVVKGERLFKPLSDALVVHVLYNEEEIALLLELDDRTRSRPGDPEAEKTQDRTLKLYPDAFAIQFPKQGAFATAPVVEKPLFRHGDAAHPTSIWYWNAGSVEPQVAPYSMILDASGVDRKLRRRQGKTQLTASGEWVNGRWRVMMKHPRNGGASGDLSFAESGYYPVSFANWDGSNGEVGSKHTLTSWYWLLLPPPAEPFMIVGLPLSMWVLTFGFGLLVVRRERQNNKKK